MRGLNKFLTAFANYHPIIIEGMGYYDPRDPAIVAQQIHSQLLHHFNSREKSITKPKLLITQGDPLSERGISAITPLVANLLGVQRGLVCLDPELHSYHSKNADRDGVILETTYSQMVEVLENSSSSMGKGTVSRLEREIDTQILDKNRRRAALGKTPLKDYYRDFALLQEVTKGAFRQLCGDLTVVHTADDISDFSVTSFYTAGVKLGLVDEYQMVSYGVADELDFEKIDTR